MDRLLNYLKGEWVISKANILSIAVSVWLIPLALSLLFTFAFSTAYQPESIPEKMSVSLENQDTGEMADTLINYLSSDELTNYIQIIDTEEADFHVEIPADYSENFTERPVTIQVEPGASQTKAKLLADVIRQFELAVLKQSSFLKAAGSRAEDIVNQMADQTATYLQASQKELYSSDQTITSAQYYSLANIFMALIILLMSEATVMSDERFKGYRQRVLSLPLSVSQRTVYDTVANILLIIIGGIFYILTWRLIDATTFAGSILVYLLWITVFSFALYGIFNLIQALFPARWLPAISQIIWLAYFVFMQFPMHDIFGGAVGEWFKNNSISQLVQEPLITYFKTGEIRQYLPLLMALLVVGLLTHCVTIIINHRKEVA